jgi:hypothetical protein
VDTIHISGLDPWPAGADQTVAGRGGITVIKDLS